MAPLSPYESAKYIMKRAKYLQVKPRGIENLAQQVVAGIRSGEINVANFSQHDLHPKSTDSLAMEWIFVVDTLNFCFWTPTDFTKYKVNGYTGYFALCAAINRAITEGIAITNAEIYSKIDAVTLAHIFRSDDGITKIPLLDQRVKCLHEVGKRLLEKWHGKFENILHAADKSAIKLLNLIVNEFQCFRDEANYQGERVAFYKRAQILVGDIWSYFRGEGLGALNDLERITMFADYRIPQVLVHFDCLEYSNELLAVLQKDVILKNGDPMEVEIRGASIYIVEKVKEAALNEICEKYPEISQAHINSILIDQFLWDYRRKHAQELENIPFHKVLSIYY